MALKQILTMRIVVLAIAFTSARAFAAEVASLSIASTPTKASVFFDDRYVGTTPVTLDGVEFGDHLLVITKHQYAPLSQALKVDQAAVSVTVELQPLGRGRLHVTTTPDQTEVFLNGTPRGKTPLILDDLLPGKYQLRLEMEGCFAIQETVEVKPDQETKIERTLESKSESYLLSAIEKDPTRVANYYDLAHHYMRLQQFDKGFEMFAKGFDACISPNLITNEQRRMYDELDRVWEGQYTFTDETTRQKLQPRILDELERGIQRQPRNVLNYWSLGSFYQKIKDWAKAADVYERGFNAVKSFRAKLYLEHNLALARYQQGYALEQQQKYDEAFALYNALLKDHPKAYYTRSALTQIVSYWMNQKKDYAKAIEEKRRFLALYTDSDLCPSIQMEIGSIYLNYLKDYAKANEAYRDYLRTYPTQDNCPTAQMSIASVYQNQLKDIPSAIREYEKLIADFPKSDSVAQALKAVVDLCTATAATDPMAKEKAARAKKRLVTEYPWTWQAAALDPDPEARKQRKEAATAYNLAVALAKSDPAKTIAGLEEVVKKYPRFAQGRDAQNQIIGIYANNLKDNEKSVQAREQFLQLFPDRDQCPAMLYQIAYTKCFVLKKMEEGVADFRRLIKTYPESALCVSAQNYIATAYGFSYGHYNREKNNEENRRLIKDYPWYDGNDVVQSTIGLNYYYQFQPGDKEKGQKELLKVIENYPYGSYSSATEYYLDLIDAGLQLDENRTVR